METGKKRLLRLSFISLIVLGLIVGWLGFGQRGFIHLYQKEKERQAYLERIRTLEKENEELLKEINRLLHDEEYIEFVARRELGLIKENEVFYRFIGEEDQ